MWTDNLYKAMINRFFMPAFRTISLMRCVSVSMYYDFVHDYKYHDSIQDNDYDRIEMSRKSYKHLRLIMERLSLTDYTDVEKQERDALFRPTIFEKKLPQLMVDEYNRVAEMFGAYTAPQGYYLYMLEDKRTWVSPRNEDAQVYAFTEHVALACIDCALQYSSIALLNSRISEGQRRRAVGRFKSIKAVLRSPVFYCAMVQTFFDLIRDEHRNRYSSVATAFEKLEKKIKKRKLKRYYQDITDVELSPKELVQRNDDDEYLRVGKIFFDCICPLSELMLIKEVPMDLIGAEYDDFEYLDLEEDNKSTTERIQQNGKLRDVGVTLEEYVIARKVARVVEDYLDSVVDDVARLLECLPETEVVGKGAFQSWFKKLKV